MNTIRNFSLNNYKSFLKETGGAEIDCRPITLIYGRNHAGKSALVRGLGLIVASLGKRAELLDLEFPGVAGATFDDLKSRGVGATIEFGLGFNTNEPTKPLELEWVIRRLNDTGRLVVERFEARYAEERLVGEYLPDEQEQDAYEFKFSSSAETEVRGAVFPALLPDLEGSAHGRVWVERFSKLSIPDVHWLSPSRAHIGRSFPLKSGQATIESDGSGYEQLLARSAEHSSSGPLLNQVSIWLTKLLGLSIEARKNASLWELICHSKEDPLAWVNIVDAGQGVQDLLPLLTLLLQEQPKPTVLLVEEPECHLHPNLHPALGELFVHHTTMHSDQMLMVETHSANLLLSLQIQIAEGKLPPENLVVYWLRWSPEGFSTADKITFDELGKPIEAWPPGVFSEKIDQARRLFQIQRQKTSSDAI